MGKGIGQAQKEAWGALLLAHAALTRAIDRQLVSEGYLSLQVYDVLLALEDAPDQRMRMSDLANCVVFDQSSLTRLIDRLEKKGYVRREGHPTDRRSIFAVLTHEGLEARKTSWPRYSELLQEHFGRHLNESAAHHLSSALNKARNGEMAERWRNALPDSKDRT